MNLYLPITIGKEARQGWPTSGRKRKHAASLTFLCNLWENRWVSDLELNNGQKFEPDIVFRVKIKP